MVQLAQLRASSAMVLVGAVAAAIVMRNLFVAAHRVLGWAVASLVVAILVEPVVGRLAVRLRRGPAVVVTMAGIGAVAVLLVYGVFDDLAEQSRRLANEAPTAAARLEARDDQVGELARDLDLTERVDGFADELDGRFRGGGDALVQAAGTVPTYLVCTILTIFLLGNSRRMLDGAIAQVRDEDRRARAAHMADASLRRGRRYILATLLQGGVVGGLAYGVAVAAELPAPTVLALGAGVVGMLPYVGILLASLPMLLLAGGFRSLGWALVVVVLFAGAQLVEALWVRRVVDRRSLHVGPAVPVIVAVMGFELHGIGAAMYGAALAVFALAVIDAIAADEPDGDAAGDDGDDDLPTPMDDWVDDSDNDGISDDAERARRATADAIAGSETDSVL